MTSPDAETVAVPESAASSAPVARMSNVMSTVPACRSRSSSAANAAIASGSAAAAVVMPGIVIAATSHAATARDRVPALP